MILPSHNLFSAVLPLLRPTGRGGSFSWRRLGFPNRLFASFAPTKTKPIRRRTEKHREREGEREAEKHRAAHGEAPTRALTRTSETRHAGLPLSRGSRTRDTDVATRPRDGAHARTRTCSTCSRATAVRCVDAARNAAVRIHDLKKAYERPRAPESARERP